jgi:hypothetical protein
MTTSGICLLPNKEKVIDRLEVDGYRINGERVGCHKIRQMIYRAIHLASTFSLSEFDVSAFRGVSF